jgi:hypothetical protein
MPRFSKTNADDSKVSRRPVNGKLHTFADTHSQQPFPSVTSTGSREVGEVQGEGIVFFSRGSL